MILKVSLRIWHDDDDDGDDDDDDGDDDDDDDDDEYEWCEKILHFLQIPPVLCQLHFTPFKKKTRKTRPQSQQVIAENST